MGIFDGWRDAGQPLTRESLQEAFDHLKSKDYADSIRPPVRLCHPDYLRFWQWAEEGKQGPACRNCGEPMWPADMKCEAWRCVNRGCSHADPDHMRRVAAWTIGT